LDDGRKKKTTRKAYTKPTARKISSEEARAKLRRLAEQGDKQAQEMLRIISGEQSPEKPDDGDLDDKKSA
jgi:hypothetical protein